MSQLMGGGRISQQKSWSGIQPKDCLACKYTPKRADESPCGVCGGTGKEPKEALDTAATLKVEGGNTFVGELNPIAPGHKATAGVALLDITRESVQGKDEQNVDFQYLMESNTPPPGIGASNRDWRKGVE